jgi:hypothetical protein
VWGERELGEGGKGLLFSVPVWEEARRAFLCQMSMGEWGKDHFFFLSLLLIFLLGGGGVWALFIYFSCYGVGQQQKGESIFFVVFFVCVGCDTMKGQTTCATNTLKNPYLILCFFKI